MVELEVGGGGRCSCCCYLCLLCEGVYPDAESVVSMLLEANASVAATDDRGATPLMMAASTANRAAFDLIIKLVDDDVARMRNVDGRDVPPGE